ncbi:MAG: radical SAM protein, partial [Thermoanaerobaculia bacterium]|nr:radical SAM protein [Thermoanaerobaculia bacterium]
PWTVAPLFEEWLAMHYPDRKAKVMNKIRAARGGKLYDSTYGKRGRGSGLFADQIRNLFETSRRRAGLESRGPSLSGEHFRRPSTNQLRLF